MKTIQTISVNTISIIEYLKDKKPGEKITYKMITTATGVNMNVAGKSYLRTALHKLKLEYECIMNMGIILASEKNTTRILVHKLVKIDNAVKRGEKSYKNLNLSFYDKLSDQERKQINFIGAAFGAIRLAAENGRQIFKFEKVSNYKSINIHGGV